MKEQREGSGRTVGVGSGVVNTSVIHLVPANGAKLQLFGSGVCAQARRLRAGSMRLLEVAQGVEPQLTLTAIGSRVVVEHGRGRVLGQRGRRKVSRP